MDIQTLTRFFMWCTIINGGMLILSSLFCLCAQGWVYRVHSSLFAMSRETFNVAMYGFLGFFKIVVIVFNVVPYIALLIVG
jgi:hypothetical protein